MAAYLPNPGFDADAFDNASYDTGVSTPEITGVANRREGMEWYTCDRCGAYYPRTQVVNQNGLNVCFGAGTNNCMDLPGHAVAVADLDIPFEEQPAPLPFISEDL